MLSTERVSLTALGMVCALGDRSRLIQEGLRQGNQSGIQPYLVQQGEASVLTGQVSTPLPTVPVELSHLDSRNTRLLLAAYLPIAGEVEACIKTYGADRVGVVLGASAQGIDIAEQSYAHWLQHGELPTSYHYNQQELGSAAEVLARYAGAQGPAYCIGTSCSSSAKAIVAARNLLTSNICDAVIVGGVDGLCQLTVQGFSALDAVSSSISNPMSRNRDGITLGEGAALFVMSREASFLSDTSSIYLLGAGESGDAHHVSSPDPSGKGAILAMQKALSNAGLAPSDIDYLNMHGTGTALNDSMESLAIAEVLGTEVPCSSTKPLTGHTLGAAGAIELGICWLTLSQKDDTAPWLPCHVWDGEPDEALPTLQLVTPAFQPKSIPRRIMSNSFAFGGNNASLIVGVDE